MAVRLRSTPNTSVLYRGFNYQEIALDECLLLAQSLAKDGKPWHSHVQNPFAGVFALVIEDDDSAIPYVANSGAAFPEVDEELVKMLHGANILDASKARSAMSSLVASRVLAHVQTLQTDGIVCHHHMHFTSCAFNPHPGKWSISIESPDVLFAEASGTELVDVLREIEVLYFDNLHRAAQAV